MSIRNKLAGIVALLLIPVILLAYLFVQQSFKDIEFAAKERSGVVYLRGAWPVLTGLVVDSNAGEVPAAKLKGPNLSQLGAQYGTAMDAVEAGRDLDQALLAIGWPAKALSRSEATEKAIAAARTLIGKVADGSNLTLDPDLDSFYVMDVVTVKLPEALERLGKIVALVREMRRQASLSDDDKAEIMIQIGLFESATSGAAGSIESAFKGNEDGAVRRKLETPFKSFADTFGAFGAEAKQVANALRRDASRSKTDLSQLDQLYADAAGRLERFWQSSATDLDRLLAARVDGLWWRMITMLGIAGVVVAIALLAAWWAARSILISIGRLDNRIRELGDREINADLPGSDGRDEIAQITRAVLYFRDRTIEKLKVMEAAANEQREARLHADAETQRAEAERQATDLRQEMELSTTLNRRADNFATTMDATIKAISNASSSMEAASLALTRTADLTERTSIDRKSVV